MRKFFTKDIQSVVIKVGTSILTKNGRFDRNLVAQLAKEVSQFLKKGIQVSIVSSGAIGAGMTILGLKKRPTAMEELQGAAAVGQRYLMQCYEETFSRYGFSTAQVLLTWDDMVARKRFLNAKHTLRQIQKWGLVPIVNENDTVATEEIRFGDNDKLSSLLSILAEADLLIILSDTNGLYAKNRVRQPSTRIQVVQKMDAALFSHVRESQNSFTVGGMRSKLNAIRMSVTAGIPVFLANGRDKKVLTRLLQGEDIGTFFIPEKKKSAAQRNWLNHFIAHVKQAVR